MEGCFNFNWRSLKVGSKFTVFSLFYSVFEGNFQIQVPGGGYIWRGDLMEGFLSYLYYIWRGLYTEELISVFYSIFVFLIKEH